MRGEKGRIFVYLADIRPLYEQELQRTVYRKLPPARQKKADSCPEGRAKAASLAAGFLAQYALLQREMSREMGLQHEQSRSTFRQPKQRCEILYPQNGAPQVQTPGGEPPLYLSLSHSGDYAACALCAHPVGIDIQQIKPIKTGLLRHFLTEQEKEAFLDRFQMSGMERELTAEAQKAFLKDWTAKESYMKLTGQGMSMGFSTLTVDWDRGLIWEKKTPKKPARLFFLEAPEGYFMSACRMENF